MNVSIIICTRDHAASLRETLADLEMVRVPDGWECEVLVVDNASTDDTRQVTESATSPNKVIRYVHEPRGGKGYAYNRGMAEAKGDIFLFTDDDVRFPPDWIAEMCEPILSGRADAVAGGFTTPPHLMGSRTPTIADGLTPEAPPEVLSGHPMIGLNMAFSRRVLAKVPAFDVELGPGALGFSDDFFFSDQLERAGYRMVRCFGTQVEHHYEESRLQRIYILKRAAAIGRSEAYVDYHWKHLQVRYARWYLVKSVVKLAMLRWLKRSELREEDISGWEYESARRVSYYRQFLLEQKKPRNYEKHGLIKRTQPAA